MRQRVPESGVLRACLDLLAAERIWHMRCNTGAVKDGKRFFRFGRKGMADILAIIRVWIVGGHFNHWVLWIEAKAADGQQRPEQIQFQQEVEAEGHAYLLVKDVDTLRDWLKERGELR